MRLLPARRSRRALLSRRHRRQLAGPLVAILLLVGGISAFVSGGREDKGDAARALAQQGAAVVSTVKFTMCGSARYTCVVDGDTIWFEGQNLRLQSYDTPEPYTAICGGSAEVALAKQASARLLDLLNTNAFTVETFGLDGTGKRTLATVRIGGRDVGDILIGERLARHWPDGDEWWCS